MTPRRLIFSGASLDQKVEEEGHAVRRTAAVQQKQKLAITDRDYVPGTVVKHQHALSYLIHTLSEEETFFFRQHCTAYGVLVPRSRVEAPSPAVEVQSLNHWTVRQAPGRDYY